MRRHIFSREVERQNEEGGRTGLNLALRSFHACINQQLVALSITQVSLLFASICPSNCKHGNRDRGSLILGTMMKSRCPEIFRYQSYLINEKELQNRRFNKQLQRCGRNGYYSRPRSGSIAIICPRKPKNSRSQQ